MKVNFIHLKKQKGIVGIAFALLFFAISCIWFEWNLVLPFVMAFAVLGFFKIEFCSKIINMILLLVWGFYSVVATWYISYTSTVTLSDISSSDDKMLLNCICILIVFSVIYIFTANYKFSICSTSFFLCLLATVSGFVNQFRGKELSMVDFLSISTALNVADKYTPYVHAETFWGWTACVLLVFSSFSLPTIKAKHKILVRAEAAVALVVLVSVLNFNTKNIKTQTWGDFGARFNGYYLNFALGIRDFSFNKPKDYSLATVKMCEEEYTCPPPQNSNSDTPDIIVIMNEAWGDFNVFGKELCTNIPVTPFIDSLKENTVRGYALSSAFGGNTANSEFEFLTGNTMAFLPQNSVAYQQYIKGDLYTLAWYLNHNGYYSTATHPCPASNWSRGRIYPYLGFKDSTFIDSYPTDCFVREYVSDQAVFDHVLERTSPIGDDKSKFTFAITMQNHSGYNYNGDNFSKTVTLEGYSREYPSAEQYLSLLNQTDTAFESFIKQIENRDKKTIVCMFGDHLPGVENEFYYELYGDNFDTIPKQMLKYKVPFLIWANYDIEEEYIDCTSLNYLSGHLLEIAEFELTPYYTFLKNLQEKIPAMNALGYFSKQYNDFVSYEMANGEEAEALKQYSILQYNNLFDADNRSKLFFDDYISFEK